MSWWYRFLEARHLIHLQHPSSGACKSFGNNSMLSQLGPMVDQFLSDASTLGPHRTGRGPITRNLRNPDI